MENSETEFLFRRKNANPIATLNKASLLANEYSHAFSPSNNQQTNTQVAQFAHKWRPSMQGMLKCNVDAAFSEQKQLEAVAAIIRDYQGRVITGKARHIHASSSMVVEALAIRKGLVLAKSCFVTIFSWNHIACKWWRHAGREPQSLRLWSLLKTSKSCGCPSLMWFVV